MIKAILFDLDGTLMDTIGDITDAFNYALSQYNKPTIKSTQLRPFVSFGSSYALTHLCQIPKDHPLHETLLDTLLEYYGNHIANHTQCFPGLSEILDQLDHATTPWGVVSNKLIRWVKTLLAAKNLAHRCHVMYGGDSFPQKKPDPIQLIKACEALAVNPTECIYVGDCAHDIQAAKAANMMSVAAAYGYVPNDANVNSWQADYILLKPSDLTSILQHHGVLTSLSTP
jgi:N-acetyl-D-muramate 6-phosphate phosphatase